MKPKVTLYDDRVLVLPEAAESKTAGGIIIPDSAKEKPQRGMVIEVGKQKPLLSKEGDIILYGKYAGQEIELDGITFIIMRETDILLRDDGRTAEAKNRAKAGKVAR